MGQPAHDPHDRAVRWRQLVDLLARGGASTDSPLARTAIQIVRDDAGSVDEPLRAAAARAVAALPLPFELISLFTEFQVKVSAPILAAAKLSLDQWRQLLDRSDEETKKFILALHPETDRRNIPRVEQALPNQESPPTQASIGEVIARIERLREQRERGDEKFAPSPLPPLPPPLRAPLPQARTSSTRSDEPPRLFRWECNAAGEFEWVDGAPRGALIGRALIDRAVTRDNDEIARAFAVRAPFRNGVLHLDEESVLAGDWQVSGVPAFEQSSGRFAGYRGIARRSAAQEFDFEAPHPDSLRELVHEIKTPLNAIMGFAEIIEGQIFGPADISYRERASNIVAQSHLLLAALEDLDFAAKSRSAGSAAVVDLGILVERLASDLRDLARKRGAEMGDPQVTGVTRAAADNWVAERLILRMCSAVIDQAAPGERLRLLADRRDDHCRVSITRPAALWGLSDEMLFGAKERARSQNFSLRLTRGLAQITGGDLVTCAETISLMFPRASLGSAQTHGYGTRTGQGL